MLFRNIIGIFCAGVGVVFLAINSGILARGAAKWGYDYWEQISYGAVAATVPWVIAIMPFLIVLSLKPGKKRQRPSTATLVGCAIWLAFVAYNLIGAAGSVAAVRDEVLSYREHAATNQQADRQTRKRLSEEYDAIPRHRPAGTVAPLLAAEKNKPFFEQTQKCTDIRKGRDQRLCAALTALESELASAKRAGEIQAALTNLDRRIAGSAPASIKVDPQARIIASFTGWSEDWVSDRLPIATPIILELGSMTLLYFAFVLMGYTHASTLQLPVRASRGQERPAPPGPSTLTSQTQLCEWFFRNCTRPHAEGALPESTWYEHYQAVCKESGDTPLPLASFRRFAEKFIPNISQIDGVTYYRQVLPYLPRRVA